MEAVAGVLWTTMPLDLVLAGPEPSPDQLLELTVEGRILQVTRLQDGAFRLERLISTNPWDYLDPRWQPGCTVDRPRIQ